MIKIGHIALRNNVFLAPMSGVSDMPFRKVAFEAGAGAVVSEMVASEELSKSRPDVVLRATNDESVYPFIVQLAGREARWMAEGAKIAAANGADIIDINMGCPSRQVTGALSGSALMRNLDHAASLIRATVDAVEVPVTLKMRLGWDHQSLNAPELAKAAEEIGVKLVTVHGRTRQQFYNGVADWDAVKNTVDAIDLPVLVNGDICTPKDATTALALSGADGVMVGRAAEGQPWLLNQIARGLRGEAWTPPSLEEQANIARQHYSLIVEHYTCGHQGGAEMGRALGIRMARKHLASYIEKLERDLMAQTRRALRASICRLNEPDQVLEMLERIFLDEIAALDAAAA